MVKLPSLSWFNFTELGVLVKDLKVSCNRILGMTIVSLLLAEFDSLNISPKCLVLSLILSIFLPIGDILEWIY